MVEQFAHPLEIRGDLLGNPFTVVSHGLLRTRIVTPSATNTIRFDYCGSSVVLDVNGTHGTLIHAYFARCTHLLVNPWH